MQTHRLAREFSGFGKRLHLRLARMRVDGKRVERFVAKRFRAEHLAQF